MGNRHLALVVCLLAACGDNLKPPEPVGLLETIAPARVAAGDLISIACTLTEPDPETGEEITTMVEAEIEIEAEDAVTRQGAAVFAKRAGTVRVACALPDRELVDDTPATVEIVVGAPANVVTTITPNPVTAGEMITATCEVFDAAGNRIDDATPTLALTPSDPGNSITDLTAVMTRAGGYGGRCVVPGATSNDAPFEVVPALPASLLLARVPDQQVYAINEYVRVDHVVADRFGNEIAGAAVTKASVTVTGAGPIFVSAPDEWRYESAGMYRVNGTVDGPTEGGAPVTATVDVLVNSVGPRIACTAPLDGGMVDHVPGTMLAVSGTASDINGVTVVGVNGVPVTVGANGSWTAPVTTRFGINFVDIEATDMFGVSTTKVCAILVATSWADPAQTRADTLSLKLAQGAIDDGNRGGAIGSFGDVLHTIINSQGLRDTVHNALLAANPLKPSSCDRRVFGACVLSSQVRYLSSQFGGPNTVALTLVNGGLHARARINDINLQLRIDGRVAGIGYDSTGWVRMSYVDVEMILDTAVANGVPRITVRPGSVSAQVGSISTDFNGFDGWLIDNVLVPLAQGRLRDMVRDLVRDYIAGNFNTVLDGLVSGLNVSSLGTTFNVPRLDGGTVAMSFAIAPSTLSSTTSRLLFGIGTRFQTTPGNAYATLGAPVPPGTILGDPALASQAPTGVAAHTAILNQALHALWRANYFAATLDAATFGSGLPPDLSVDIAARLPPVATILPNGTVEIHLGAVDATVVHPDLPPNTLVTLGVRAHASVTLSGNDLSFGAVAIDEVFISSDLWNGTAAEQMTLEDGLRQVAQQLVDQALNNALPALPIPRFTLPAALGPFGLPVGAQLGLDNPALSVSPQHFVLRGQLGL